MNMYVTDLCCLAKQIIFSAGNENEKQDKDKRSMKSSVTPVASVGDGVEGTDVMLVSHPPVRTCSNPALQQYRVYLQSVYQARDLAPADNTFLLSKQSILTLPLYARNSMVVNREMSSQEQHCIVALMKFLKTNCLLAWKT